MKPWKKLYFKSIIKCFKRVKIDISDQIHHVPHFPHSFLESTDYYLLIVLE